MITLKEHVCNSFNPLEIFLVVINYNNVTSNGICDLYFEGYY